MRCEICNKSMTYAVHDGSGETHWYCQDCDDIIEETTHELEDDAEEWFLEDLVYLEEVEGYYIDESEDTEHDPALGDLEKVKG